MALCSQLGRGASLGTRASDVRCLPPRPSGSAPARARSCPGLRTNNPEAAKAFGVESISTPNPEVLIMASAPLSRHSIRAIASTAAAVSSRSPYTAAAAVTEAERRLRVAQLDPLNQRHNAFLAAAAVRRCLDEMHGDLSSASRLQHRSEEQRVAFDHEAVRRADFVTLQSYLRNLPHDYPIRVLSAALAYQVWHIRETSPATRTMQFDAHPERRDYRFECGEGPECQPPPSK